MLWKLHVLGPSNMHRVWKPYNKGDKEENTYKDTSKIKSEGKCPLKIIAHLHTLTNHDEAEYKTYSLHKTFVTPSPPQYKLAHTNRINNNNW